MIRDWRNWSYGMQMRGPRIEFSATALVIGLTCMSVVPICWADSAREETSAVSPENSGVGAGTANILPAYPHCSLANSTSPKWQLCDRAGRDLRPPDYSLVSSLLGSGVQVTRTLCDIDAALVQAHQDCATSPDAMYSLKLLALMRDLANQWQLQGHFDRAEDIYKRLYARSSVQPPGSPLWVFAGNLVPEWARFRLDRHDPEAARDLVAGQVRAARLAYDLHHDRIVLNSLIQALKSQATVLIESDAIDEALQALQDLSRIQSAATAAQGPTGQPWMASYVVPRLRPSVETMKEIVETQVQGTKIRTSVPEFPLDHSFAYRIEFIPSNKLKVSAKAVALTLVCGTAIKSPAGTQVDQRPGFQPCRSFVTESRDGIERILQRGPTTEIDLHGGDDSLKAVEQWASEVTLFIRDHTGEIVSSLQQE